MTFPEADLCMIQKGKSVELINVKHLIFCDYFDIGFVNRTVSLSSF